MTLNGNDCFTSFYDGQTLGTHRSAEQVRNVTVGRVTYVVHLSGTFDDGTGPRHNAFAKKHLITFKGGHAYEAALGSGGGRGTDPRAKAERILGARFNRATLDTYNARRATRQAALSAPNRGQYPANALGGAVTKRNTVVVCDYVDPDEMWSAFARGMAEKRWRSGQAQAIKVDFQIRKTSKDYCIISSDASGQVSEEGTSMRVLAHCTSATGNTVEAHVVHFEGVE